jgi:hypothetical protein
MAAGFFRRFQLLLCRATPSPQAVNVLPQLVEHLGPALSFGNKARVEGADSGEMAL